MATVKDADHQGATNYHSLKFGNTVLLRIRSIMEGDTHRMEEDDQFLYRTDSSQLKLHSGTTGRPTIRSSTFKIVSVNKSLEDSTVCIGDELQLEHTTTNDLIAIDNTSGPNTSAYNYRSRDSMTTTGLPVYLKDQNDSDTILRVAPHFKDQAEGEEIHYRELVTLEATESNRNSDGTTSLSVEFHEPGDHRFSSHSDYSRTSDDIITVSYQTKPKSSSSSSLTWLQNSGNVYVSSHAIQLTPTHTSNTSIEVLVSESDETEKVQQIDELQEEEEEEQTNSNASDDNSFENMFKKYEPKSATFNPSTETLMSESLDDQEELQESQVSDVEQVEDKVVCDNRETTTTINNDATTKETEVVKCVEKENPANPTTPKPQQPTTEQSPPPPPQDVTTEVKIEHPKHERRPEDCISQIKRHIDSRLKVKVPKVKLIEKLNPISKILTELQEDLTTTSTDPWIQEFLDAPNNGHDALIDLIRDLIDDPTAIERKNKRRYSVLDRNTECLDAALLCTQLLIKHEKAMVIILRSYFSSHLLVQCLYLGTASSKAKTLALEILTTFLQAEDARGKVIEAFDHFRMEKKERMRFETLMDSLQHRTQPSEQSYQVAVLHFINTVVRTTNGVNEKIFCQQQFLDAGFRPKEMENYLDDKGLDEVEEWHKNYVDVQQYVDELEKCKIENEQLSIELLLAKKQLQEATNRCDKLEKDIEHLQGKDKILRDELRRAQQYLHKAKLDREFLKDQTKELMLKVDYQNPEDLRSSPGPWEHMDY